MIKVQISQIMRSQLELVDHLAAKSYMQNLMTQPGLSSRRQAMKNKTNTKQLLSKGIRMNTEFRNYFVNKIQNGKTHLTLTVQQLSNTQCAAVSSSYLAKCSIPFIKGS